MKYSEIVQAVAEGKYVCWRHIENVVVKVDSRPFEGDKYAVKFDDGSYSYIVNNFEGDEPEFWICE